jgi:hypothetical protein
MFNKKSSDMLQIFWSIFYIKVLKVEKVLSPTYESIQYIFEAETKKVKKKLLNICFFNYLFLKNILFFFSFSSSIHQKEVCVDKEKKSQTKRNLL